MAHAFDLVTLAYGTIADDGSIAWRAYAPLTGDDDTEDFGDLAVYQSLGVTSRPFPADDDGRAEGAVLRGAGGLGILFGGRDSRCSGIYGQLGDGDSCLHATGPDAIAQVQTKANRQVVGFTKDADGDGMIQLLDGDAGKVQISYAGAIIEINKAEGHVLIVSPSGGASITLKDDSVIISATNIYLGNPLTAVLQVAGGAAASITSVPPVLVPASNVFMSPG
jgi:hypothetical protein